MNATANPPSTSSTPATATSAPACGVNESLQKPLYSVSGTADAYEVRIEMPGVPKTGVKIDFADKVLTVHGERKVATLEGWKSLHRELPSLNYQLRLRLNAPVDEEQLKATMENGILTLLLPVRETAKPRRIAVQ
jgi:HSP20 family protein